MPTIQDDEFGKITIRRSAKATQVRLRVAPDGSLRASLPIYAPLFLVKRLVKNSRGELRKLLQQSRPGTEYHDGMQIGKSHTITVRPSTTLSAKHSGTQIILGLPPSMMINDENVITVIRESVIKALKIEAKSYLPKRLKFLAEKYGFDYEKVRFSHASSRWGSCSSKGTISLNIALMKLPFELIDYVIIHELSHTVHLNHSQEFWQLVKSADPDFIVHRKRIKAEVPSI